MLLLLSLRADSAMLFSICRRLSSHEARHKLPKLGPNACLSERDSAPLGGPLLAGAKYLDRSATKTLMLRTLMLW